jgi:N-carbamoyl-L-amino-acid hydrolase
VGRLQTATDGPSTVVGQVSFVIDIRHPDADTLGRLSRGCASVCASTGKASGCAVNISEHIGVPPTVFDETCVDALERGAVQQGYSYKRMASGALHDASNIARVVPTAMIFVPCRNGISHNVQEYASAGDLAAGANVLLRAMLELSK